MLMRLWILFKGNSLQHRAHRENDKNLGSYKLERLSTAHLNHDIVFMSIIYISTINLFKLERYIMNSVHLSNCKAHAM